MMHVYLIVYLFMIAGNENFISWIIGSPRIFYGNYKDFLICGADEATPSPEQNEVVGHKLKVGGTKID